jgi:hypothetical protein
MCHALAAAYGDKFALFCPSKLVQGDDLLLKSYRGEVRYSDIPFVCAASEVVLCPCVDITVDKYINERLACASACAANILCDKVKGLVDLFGDTVEYMDPDVNIVTQVEHACGRPNLPEVRERLLAVARELFEVGRWCRHVCATISAEASKKWAPKSST